MNEDLKAQLNAKLGSKSSSRLALAVASADEYMKLSEPTAPDIQEGEVIVRLHATSIDPNPYQHRTRFEQDKIDELRISMELNGQNQPIGVRKNGDRYQIIFGERRWRAALGTEEKLVDAVVRDVSDLEMRYICLSENSNREAAYDYEKWIGIQHLIEIDRPVAEITSRMGISVPDYYKIRCFGAFPAELKEFMAMNPSALQRNDAQEVAKIYKDFGSEIPEGLTEDFIRYMEMYLKKEIRNRGDIVKRIKSKYVSKKSRNREKVNQEHDLNIEGARVGLLVKTPSEFRIIVDKSELSKDKLDELEEMVSNFFHVSKKTG